MECKKWDLIGREGERQPGLNGWVKVPRPPLNPAKSWLSACQSGSEFPFRHPAFVHGKKKLTLRLWASQLQKKKKSAHTQILFFQYQQLPSRSCAGGRRVAVNTACAKPFPSVEGSTKQAAASPSEAPVEARVVSLYKIASWSLLRIQPCVEEVV